MEKKKTKTIQEMFQEDMIVTFQDKEGNLIRLPESLLKTYEQDKKNYLKSKKEKNMQEFSKKDFMS